jgi:hypothetical protein
MSGSSTTIRSHHDAAARVARGVVSARPRMGCGNVAGSAAYVAARRPTETKIMITAAQNGIKENIYGAKSIENSPTKHISKPDLSPGRNSRVNPSFTKKITAIWRIQKS